MYDGQRQLRAVVYRVGAVYTLLLLAAIKKRGFWGEEATVRAAA
jgi:hypothetical protein